ncbi:Transcription factor fungi [Macrophomina phaseolina MS6]|uniref:Transcription factor fungi n=1 Tax=Macrophomina phaseolina (strain MS6) TaxID=1126212 RepID=K2SBJ1_MACPH|nr:Transcription factor fungi [Macrophomina phaseolina MS6]
MGAADRADTKLCLPAKHEAVGLFYHYNAHVNYLHYVIHAPSVLELLDHIYSRPVDKAEPTQVALLMGMLAGAAYFWNPTAGVFAAEEEAKHASSAWLEAALEVLHQARRVQAVCLEEVQATIIVSYLVYNLEGFSSRFRLLNTQALGLARDLSLHRMDDGPLRPSPHERLIQSEVKRRVWWHIVSVDWLLAFTPGPQEGTYLVNPRHMAVNLPQNADDQQLEHGRRLPPTQPTTMAYFLQRVRLAEICRHVADAMTEPPFGLRQTDSATLRDLDAHFVRFLDCLPPFFRLDGDDSSRQKIERQFPHVGIQRFLIHLGVHTRRSKLHQPWLARGYREPEFAFARDACLQSSRTVLQVARLLEEERQNHAFAPTSRLCTVVHHVTMAAVVLIVDLCFTKARGAEEERRKLEIVDACQILERSRRESAVAEKMLMELNDVLKRHKVHLPPVMPSTGPPIATVSADYSGFSEPVPGVQLPSGQQGNAAAPFNSLLHESVDIGFNLDIPAWDKLFADLNACPIFNTDLPDFSL